MDLLGELSAHGSTNVTSVRISIGALAIHHRLTITAASGRELCWVAPTAITRRPGSAPVRCTPPRRRLQSTVRDGRSPGSRVAARSPPSREFPVAPAGPAAYSCGAAPASEYHSHRFPFHRGHAEGGHQLRRQSLGRHVVSNRYVQVIEYARCGDPGSPRRWRDSDDGERMRSWNVPVCAS